MATIQFKQVSKVYEGGVRAVDAIDLSIGEGEFCVLVGPSGCGKSTTLRMLAGLEDITDGTLELDAQCVNDLSAKDRDIAFVFQNYALYPHLTVAQNIAFGLESRRTHRSALVAALRGNSAARHAESAAIEARVASVSHTLGLDALLQRRPRELSGGQRQRVAVGRAIARDPKVFLFDEPLSNLDARLRIETRAELRQLHRRLRATIVYVTHDQEEAMTLADRLVVMHAGTCVEYGTVPVVRAHPKHPYTLALENSRIDRAQPGSELRTINGSPPAVGNWSTGCRFAARCDHAQPDCVSGPSPQLMEVAPGHYSSCLHPELLEVN